jgi:hypothetical protein
MLASLAKQLPSAPFAGQHDPDLEAIVLSIVIGSVCYVEAVGNEVFSRCAEQPGSPSLATLTPQDVAAAGAYWTAKGGRLPSNSIEKWQLLATSLGKPKLNPDEPAITEMRLLVKLRNRCIHAKPSHWPTQDEDKQLEQELRGKFALNKYDGNTLFFPNEVLSADCAAWAIDTASSFVEHAAGAIGLQLNYGLKV